MSIELCILASGSRGNCTIVRTPGGTLLIDCGIGPRTAAARMKNAGASLEISAICLTHLDRDHFNPNWMRFLIQRQVAIYCHESRREDLRRMTRDPELDALVRPFNGAAFEPLPGLSCAAIALAHDAEGSHGFIFERGGARVAYATDLGRVPENLLARFEGCDIIGLESNYDPQMQRDSGRPIFLQRRIMGGRGHLSNQQALEALRRILDRGRRLPRHIVLLHRSQQCNCPKLLRNLFSADPRIASRLTLAEQDQPTPWLAAQPRERFVGRQLELAFNAV